MEHPRSHAANSCAAPNKLRLAVVTETFPPEINGVANTLRQVVEGLHRNGHALLLVRPGQRGAWTPPPGVQEVLTAGLPLPGYPGLQFGLPARRKLRRLWRAFAPDAAYVATEGPLGQSALGAARDLGIPTLTGMHTNFHQYSRHYGMGLLSSFIEAYLRRFHNQSGGTLTPTREMADTLVRHGFAKVAIWPRGVDTELFQPARRDRQLRTRWGAGADRPVVMYVGRIAPEKNVDLALRAYRAVAERQPGARFVLVGDGPARERLEAECPEAVFTGPRVGPDLAAHYASGDIFVFPSLTETFGNVVLEAMASGLATLAYDTAAAHELIRDGKNGVLAPPGDEATFLDRARTLAQQPADRQRLGDAARQTALQHDWPALIDRFEDHLRKLVARPWGDTRDEAVA